MRTYLISQLTRRDHVVNGNSCEPGSFSLLGNAARSGGSVDGSLGRQMTKSERGDGRIVLRKVAYDSFMQNLLSGAIKPGQMLSQRELCELLSVPLGPVREALKRLEAENIVSLIPQRGIRIIDIDEDVIDEVYQLRKLVELEAITAFGQDMPRERLLDLLQRTENAAEVETRQNFDIAESHQLTDLDHEMHRMFIHALHNRFVEEIHRRVLDQLKLVRFINRVRRLPSRNALQEHTAILRSLLEGKVDDARDQLGDHLEASWKRARGF